MKKALFILFMLFLVKASWMNAQGAFMAGSGFWYNYMLSEENRMKEKNKEIHLKQRSMIDPKHPSSNRVYKYDEAGRMVFYTQGKKEIRNGYISDEQKSFVSIYKKGKLIELDSFVWEGKNMKECMAFDEDRQLFKRERYKHDSTFVTEYVYEKKKKGKWREYRKNVYEYNPDYSYNKITYHKKGKPSYFTVFDCNPAGQNHKVQKDSSYACIKYDLDSLGNKVKVTLTNSKGQSWKTLEYFNKKDECIARKTYDMKKNEELMWAYYFKPGSTLMTKFVSYKNSKEFYRIEHVYNQDNNCTETLTYHKTKLEGRGLNTLNEKGLITSTEKYNKKGRKKEEIRYEYQYY